MRTLEIFGSKGKKTITLSNGQYYIGRGQSLEIVLDEKGISRNHSKLDVTDNEVTVTDLSSLNGTFVNEVEINSQVLKDGDFIRIGSVSILFTERDDQPRPDIQPEKLPQAGRGVPAQPRKSILAGLQKKIDRSSDSEIQIRIFSLHLIIALIAFFILFIVILPGYKNLAREELIQIGRTYTNFLSMSNRDALIKGQTMLLDTETVMREKGVDAAYILDKEGKIVQPPTLEKSVNEISRRAVSSNKLLIQDIEESKIVFSVPIWGETGRLGTARVDFNMEALVGLNQRTNILVILSTLVAFFMAILFSSISVRTVLNPLERLKGEIDICIKENLNIDIKPVQNPQINKLIETINRLIVRARGSIKPSSDDMEHLKKTGKIEAVLDAEEVLKVIPFGILILNSEFKAKFCNDAARDHLEILKSTNINDKHLLELLKPGKRLNSIMDSVKELTRSNQNAISWSEPDADRVNSGLELQLVADKNAYGKIGQWILIVKKRNENE
ncbi:FHA domain-containing protein [candidate division CSSED10-310 bacterium]|uniref:FHA domain-containing protein n=1 Tax=candidate division CSSED10-310 bacterium TaxID=2855610 RepID=A0ABV6YWA3_UNCC1